MQTQNRGISSQLAMLHRENQAYFFNPSHSPTATGAVPAEQEAQSSCLESTEPTLRTNEIIQPMLLYADQPKASSETS